MSSTDAERIPVKSYFLTAGKMYDILYNGKMHMGGIFLFTLQEDVASFEFGATSKKYGKQKDFPKEGTTFYKHVPKKQEPEHGDEKEPALKVPSDEKKPALIVPRAEEESILIPLIIDFLETLKPNTYYSFEFINGTKVGKYIENNGTTMFCQVPRSGRVSTPLSWLKSVKNVSA